MTSLNEDVLVRSCTVILRLGWAVMVAGDMLLLAALIDNNKSIFRLFHLLAGPIIRQRDETVARIMTK